MLRLVRELAPGVPILVRTAHEADIDRLRTAGATEVVPEIIEGSLMLASHALALAGVPLSRVLRRVQKVRENRYALLQGFFHGADDTAVDEIEEAPAHLRAVSIMPASPSAGRALAELRLGGARVTTVVRGGGRVVDPPADLVVQTGDTLVLSGTLEQVGTGESHILHG